MDSIPELVSALVKNVHVLALVEFGSHRYSDKFGQGDYDLLVVLDEFSYQVRSIHFYVGAIPIDLNLRAIDYFRELTSLRGFEKAFANGRVIHDPGGELTLLLHRLHQNQVQDKSERLSENDINRIRHWHRHVLDKVQGRLESEPTFCHFLLHANLYWLLENYFRVRSLPYDGPKQAFNYLKQSEPEIYAIIQDFHGMITLHEKRKLTRELTNMILQPISGMWQKDEIIAFGDDDSQGLDEHAQEIFDWLFR